MAQRLVRRLLGQFERCLPTNPMDASAGAAEMTCANDTWREAALNFSHWAVIAVMLLTVAAYKLDSVRAWLIGEE
jgi:hypothetical protein